MDHAPIGLVISPGGHWAYVLEQDAGSVTSFVQAVDLYSLSQNKTVTAGKPLQVGDASQQIVISTSGTFL